MGVTKMLANLGLPQLVLPLCGSMGIWQLSLMDTLLLFSDCPPASSCWVFWPFFWACDSAFQHYSTNPFSLGPGRSKTQGHSSVGRILSNHLSFRICLPISCRLASKCRSPGPAGTHASFLLAERLSFLVPLLQNKQIFCL